MKLFRKLARATGAFFRDLRNADRRRVVGGVGMALVLIPVGIPGAVPGLTGGWQALMSVVVALGVVGVVSEVLGEVSKARAARLALERADADEVERIRWEAKRSLGKGDGHDV